MPRIITKGQLPGERLYRLNCSNCGTVFECLQKELTRYDSQDQRDAGLMQATCPLEGCGNKIFAGRSHLVQPAPTLIPGPFVSGLHYPPGVRTAELRPGDRVTYGER
ncbi:hypothetical protein GFK26_18455 [Variovorax paradoxus]|uniref:Uncharacterized protein n=1 Tax=Variovorax paradoxus TaxID=34073 RepID=A0A5Q0M4D7_VARPD|nr:hypothetical protein [Variovorax paradoxus]QFZ84610.1 hypothetical protein GFK26_18455 [Variovorax paradoxus]